MIKSERSFERAKAMERNKKRYTIYDVAKQASVSPSTVSHVLNGTASISEETQKRIRAAIRELNYRPNANARALRQLHSHILGVTFPDIASEYYAACTASIIQHAQRHKYVVLASDLHFDNNVLAASIPALVERRVDGLIFIGGTEDEAYLRMAVDAGVPVVLGDRCVEGFPCVQFNNFETMRKLVCALYDAGYRRFGYTGETPKQQQNLEQRFNGFRSGLQLKDVPPENGLILINERMDLSRKMPSAYRQFYRYFRETPAGRLPEVLLTSNDMIAQGVISAALRVGLRVPEDIAVFGFDNISIAECSTPAISSVVQDPYTLGERCFDMLLRRMRGERCENVMLEQQIVVRASAPLAEAYLNANGLCVVDNWQEEL